MAATIHNDPGTSVPDTETAAQNGADTPEGLGFQSEKAKAKAEAKAKAKAEKEAKKAANVRSIGLIPLQSDFLICTQDLKVLNACCEAFCRLQHEARSKQLLHSQMRMTL